MTTTTNRKYAIADQKKADLDSLSNNVLAAEFKVSELQAVVTSLEQKSTKFSMFLTEAETSRDTALGNLNLFKTTLNSVKDLLKNAETLSTQAATAKKGIDNTAKEVSALISQLIYSGDMVNKFAQLVFNKKQQNPLISDELVQTVTTATADVNEAIAVTLTALQSCYASKGVAGESKNLCSLEQHQAAHLYGLMTGDGSEKLELPKSPTLLNTDKLNLLLADVSTAEQSVHDALDGKPVEKTSFFGTVTTLEAQFIKADETDIANHKASITAENKLNRAKQDGEDENEIKKLDAAYKKAATAFKSSHSKLEVAATKLIEAFEADIKEPCSVTSAQKYLQECKSSLADLQKEMKEEELAEKALLQVISEVKDPDEKQKLMCAWRIAVFLLSQYDDFRLKCLNAKLEHAVRWLAVANHRFIAADKQLLKANKLLSSEKSLQHSSVKLNPPKSLKTLLEEGYSKAVQEYDKALNANRVATKQLDAAQANLADATHNLSSLQAGLSAATAAAVAA